MSTSPFHQLHSLLFVWLLSYRRTPLRLYLIVVSIAATCLTFNTGWNLADALDQVRPVASNNAYLILAVGAGTETRSFIPLLTYEQLRSAFSAAPALHTVNLHGTLVLPTDIILSEHNQDRLPVMLRGLQAGTDGNLADLTLIAGRQPILGQRELLLSPDLNAWLQARRPGDSLKLAQVEWHVVGVAQRNGMANQVEMYSTLPALQQQFRVTDIVSSISLTLDSTQLAEVKQLSAQLKGSHLELIPANSYSGQFVSQLHSQLRTFWLVFLVVTMTCTGFGIHTIALALEIDREKVRQILLQLGFAPHAIRQGEIIEGSIIGVCGAGVALLLYTLLCRNLQMQSLLPSGAVNLSLHTSLSGVLLTVIMGGSAGAIIFAWRRTSGAWLNRP